MLARRIIPCLDVLNGRVVKGRQFENLTDVGDPVELAARYSDEGADELVVLDIAATLEQRAPFYHMVEQIARRVAIPLTIGGGIRSLDNILTLLRCGADKVTLNTILTESPSLLPEAAARVGSQALVAALDAKQDGEGWRIKTKSGTAETALDAVEWAKTVVARGAGEILVTSIDRDGTRSGYDIGLLRQLVRAVNVPIVASGGAGTIAHILDAFLSGNADAVLAASIFHYNDITIRRLKEYLGERGVRVRVS